MIKPATNYDQTRSVLFDMMFAVFTSNVIKTKIVTI